MNACTARKYGRWIGVLYVITLVAGGWGEAHVPNTLLLANDVAGTAHKVASSLGLFRASFVAYLVEAVCDVTLNVLLYALLRPVSRNLAFLAVCLGLMATSIYIAGELIYFAAALPAVDADIAQAVSPDAKATLTYLCLSVYGYVNGIFAIFYGTAALLRGYLMLRSGYFPRALGGLLMFGGAGFVTENLLVVLAPEHDSPYVLAPMFLAMSALTLWFWIKGIDRMQWNTAQTYAAAEALR